jgi:hypothetical protein
MKKAFIALVAAMLVVPMGTMSSFAAATASKTYDLDVNGHIDHIYVDATGGIDFSLAPTLNAGDFSVICNETAYAVTDVSLDGKDIDLTLTESAVYDTGTTCTAGWEIPDFGAGSVSAADGADPVVTSFGPDEFEIGMDSYVISFSEPMDRLSFMDALEADFDLEGAMTEWNSADTTVFITPGIDALADGETYNVTVTGALSQADDAESLSFSGSFSAYMPEAVVLPFEVDAAYTLDGSSPSGYVDTVEIMFEDSMEVTADMTTASNWEVSGCYDGSVSYGIDSVEAYDGYDDGDSLYEGMSLHLVEGETPDTGVICRVYFMDQEVVARTSDHADPAIISSSPSEGGALDTDGSGVITITFSEAMDSETFMTDSESFLDDSIQLYGGDIPVMVSAALQDDDQSVTVTYDDLVEDGAFTLVVNPDFHSQNGESVNYNELAFTTIPGIPSIIASTLSGNVSEDGSTATFSIYLGSRPTSDVTIYVDSTDLTEGTVSSEPIYFTPEAWDASAAQTITVTGIDDSERDGNVEFFIEMSTYSSDSRYSDLAPTRVSVVNTDNDVRHGGGGGGGGSRPTSGGSTSTSSTPSGSVLGTTDVSFEPGDFIRSASFSTVYYVDADGMRHPFIDKQTYFTYSNTWSDVVWVTDAELSSHPLGAPMLPHAGVVLVKIMSANGVYAVDSTGALRMIPSESMAAKLFGAKWADYVIDVEPTHFKRFSMGADVTASYSVDLSAMKTRAYVNSK